MSIETPKVNVNISFKRTSIYFYLMSTLTSFLNFLYYPLLSRMLPVDLYGEVQFIVTILFQASVLFLALNVVTVLLSLKYSHEAFKLGKKIAALSSALNILTVILTIVLVLAISLAHERFGFESPLPIVAMGIAIISTVPFTLGIGLLQGKNSYLKAGALNVTGSGLKLAISALLVALGFGATGAILGIAAGQLIAVLLFMTFGRNGLSFSDLLSFSHRGLGILKSDRLLMASCVWIILINILTSLDTIISKSTLSPEQAGEYAGIATLSKIAIFAVSPLMWLVIPSAVRFSQNSKSVVRLLSVAAAFCVALVVSYFALGNIFIEAVVGVKYLTMGQLLVPASIGASLLALSAMTGVVLIARQLYMHAAKQSLLMIFAFLGILVLGLQTNSPLTAVLYAQIGSGVTGVIYYSIIRYIK